VGAATYTVVAGIASSKRMAEVPAVSANSPRYRGCRGCRARRAATAQAPGVGAAQLVAVAAACGVFFNTEIPCRYLICLGGVAAADTVGLARGQCDAMPREY
jgi:hypothetical protein